jgi:hypothetical protein
MIGFTVIDLFKEPQATSVKLCQGTPRILLSGKTYDSIKKTGVVVKYKVQKFKDDKLLGLSKLVDSNCLVGPLELIPGLKNSKLSA